MRVLVTGAQGFVGRHMVPELARAGHTPLCLVRPGNPDADGQTVFECDIRDPQQLQSQVAQLNPDGCVHLAGIAFVPLGWTEPEQVFLVNLLGTLHLLEACRTAAPGARVLIVTSSEVYGRSPSPQPLSEEAPLEPSNLYGVSKVGADLSALLYARRHGLHIMTARPHNHIGPGQSSQFVTYAFAEQIARIARGASENVIRVGNIDCRRDFTDVRDVARAYRLLLERGRAGEAYNVASGQVTRVRRILDELCALAEVSPKIEVEERRFRPSDDPPQLDVTKLRSHVDWAPQIPLGQTLRDVYADVLHRTAGTT